MVNNSEQDADAVVPHVRLLEARYIELLEKRIVQLESISEEFSRDGREGKTRKSDAKDLTSNDRVEQHLESLTNGGVAKDGRRASISSNTGSHSHSTKIRFREIRYNETIGVEETKDVIENETLEVGHDVKPKDADDIVWTRRFDEYKKYVRSEVQLLGMELRDVFRALFAGDPRLHIATGSRDEVELISPFGPLVQRWDELEKLTKTAIEDDEWQELRRQVEETRRKSHTPSVEPDPRKTLEKAREDLAALMERIRSSPDIETYLSAIRTANTNRTIHFENLWTIFPPGELVYAMPFMKEGQIFIVKECGTHPTDVSDSGRTNRDTRKVWDLHCWSYDWDGKHFTRVPVMFRFEEFTGAKVINTLHCHPLRYRFPDGDPNSEREKFEADLVERGKLFRKYCARTTGEQMIYYEGDTISHGSGFQRLKNKSKQNSREDDFFTFFGRRRRRESPFKTSEQRQITGPVMVDFSSYLQHAPNASVQAPMGDLLSSYKDDECNCGSCTSNIPLQENQRRHFDRCGLEPEFESEEQYLLCPPRVLGYHLHTRTWLELNIRHFVKKETQNDDAFNRLQLDAKQKDLIKKLVQSHTSSTQKAPLMEDIVRGKGKGLVMLLHGPPGVGKTLTAESVAALTGKPLFAVSPSDIGLDATDVEHNLESLFELAANWRAVLLFDEADVFLESRSSHNSDLQRNATVSVLLRVLEYYQGILILTTNRIKQFDIAVLSRVNLGIKYEPLDHFDKAAIFEDFLMRVENKSDIERREKIIEWFKRDSDAKEWFKPLNGRQVRNVLFSAACLGSAESDKLTLDHIKTMAKCTFKFQDSLLFEMQKWTKQNEAGRDDHY